MRARAWAVLALFVASCGKGPERPGTLVVAMEQDVITLDPHRHDDSVTHSVLSNVYDPLVTFDREMRIVPALAASWSCPSDLVWRFHLRPGVTFHDGRPLTAADVEFSLRRALRAKSTHYLLSVRRIEAVDATTLELETSEPQPMLLNKIAVVGIVPSGTAEPLKDAIGTGAYRVVGRVPGKALTLAANERFWGGVPAIRSAAFRVIPDPAARARALLEGEIQLAREVPRGGVDGRPGVRFVSHPGLAVVVLGVNFRVPGPLQRKEVRQAIFWAADPRELVVKAGVEGVPADQIVPASVFGFLPGKEAGRPRPERSRELLRSAGYPDGFEVTLEMPSTYASGIGPALAAQLGRVGIRTTVRAYPWPELVARLTARASPSFVIGWACYGDASDILDAMLHSPDGKNYGASNFGGYANPLLDRAIEGAGAILLPQLRLVRLHEAMTIVREELPLIPLYNKGRSYGMAEAVVFQPRQNGQVILREVSWAGASPAR